MKKLAERGWLGITWPKQYGGQDGEGVYEFLLNEALAGRGGPQIGKGIGIIGKTLIRVGSDELKQEFLPQDPRRRSRVRGRLQRTRRGFRRRIDEVEGGAHASSDGVSGWLLNGQKTWTTSAHFADWYWVGARTDPDAPKHAGITLFLVPLDHPGITINGIWTMGDERTNDVFFDDVFVPDAHVVGELNSGFQYISSALDLERFTMFTFSPMRQRLDVLCDYVRDTEVDGEPLKDDPVVRSKIAQLVDAGRSGARARPAGRRCVGEVRDVVGRRRRRSSRRCTSCSRPSSRAGWRTPSMDIGGPGAQLRVQHRGSADGGPQRSRRTATP